MHFGSFVRAGCATVLFSAAAAVHAAPVTYTLDAGNSGLSLSGEVSGQTIGGQISDIKGTSNKLEADRTGNTIKFLGGSSAVVPNRSGRYAPGEGPDPDPLGTAPANFGFTAGGTSGAVRDLRFHFVSPSATTITGGKISPGSFSIVVDNGWYDFVRNDFQTNSIDLAGTYLNMSASQPSFATSGGVETATVPFQFSVPASTLTSGDTALTFTGAAVGTAPATAVPEPGALMALPLLGGMLLRGGRRRRA